MNTPKVSIIAALAKKNRVIGNKGKIPWRIAEDWQRFKRITSGHPIIMGRKTREAIGKALPNRTNIVITRDQKYAAPDCTIVHSLEEALEKARAVERPDGEIFVIGGGQIYEQAMPIADKLYLTLVEGDYQGDAFFPDYANFCKVVSEVSKESEGYRYTFLDLERGQ